MRGHQRGHGHRHGHHHHAKHGRHENSEEKIGRLLGHGELRYVILSLLKDKPRHGYDLIRSLEELSSGAYSPSPGSIYPTLTFLEEGGFASATTEQNKKLYSITDEGLSLLRENDEFVSALLERFSKLGEKMSRLKQWVGRDEVEEVAREKRQSIRRSMHRLKAELFDFVDAKPEQKNKVVEIIDRAVEDIQKLKGAE